MAKAWDGSMRCLGTAGRKCWEIRHPQDFIRPVMDIQTTEWIRPWIPQLAVGTLLVDTTHTLATVSATDGAKFPQAVLGVTYFLATITDGINFETVKVTDVFGGFLTLGGRGLGGTTEQTWSMGLTIQAVTDLLSV